MATNNSAIRQYSNDGKRGKKKWEKDKETWHWATSNELEKILIERFLSLFQNKIFKKRIQSILNCSKFII